MKTEDLITILSQTQPPRPGFGFTPALALLCALSLTAIILTLGVRSDLMASMVNGEFWFKTGFLGATFILALLMVRETAYPVRKKSILPWLYAALWAGLAIGAGYEIATQAGALLQWRSATGLACSAFVLGYGLIGQILLVKIMRHFAPTNLAAAGSSIALAAAGAGAIGYSIHCDMDNPAYILLAYGVPTFILAFAGSKILPRFIRW